VKNIFFLAILFVSISSFSQIRTDSIRKIDSLTKVYLKKRIDSLQKRVDSIKKIEEAEKKLQKKKWSVEGRFSLLFSQSSYSNWISGGENAVSANVGINYDFNYQNDEWKWDNKIISSFGSSYISDQGFRKTDDRIEYNSVLGYNTGKSWYFSFFSNFISQYARGYDYSGEEPLLVSSTLSPAYWSFGPGMLWRKNENLRINISPATSRFTFVSKSFSGEYGVDEGKTSSFSLGFNLSGYFKFKIFENLDMENIVQVYSDYLKKPQNIDVNYQTNFFLTVNKYLSLNTTLHFIIDDNASNTFQFRQIFGFGLNYTFHKI
jgi:hypothetical protein